jgi:hypothetical protein
LNIDISWPVIALVIVIAFAAYAALANLTGISVKWFLRAAHHREISQLLRGAIAMGPEGWTQIGGDHFKTRRGDIRIQKRNLLFIVGGNQIPLAYPRDQMLLARTCAKWEKHFNKKETIDRERHRLDEALKHIALNRDVYDLLDKEVVAKICQIKA